MKAKKAKFIEAEPRDEHELLQQEDFTWLANFRDVLSPYWSLRVEYQMMDGRRVS